MFELSCIYEFFNFSEVCCQPIRCNRLVFFSFKFSQFSVATTCSYMHWRRYFYRFVHLLSIVAISKRQFSLTHSHHTCIHNNTVQERKTSKSLAQPHDTYAMFRLWICRIVSSPLFFFSLSSVVPKDFWMFVNLVYDWHLFDSFFSVAIALQRHFHAIDWNECNWIADGGARQLLHIFFVCMLNVHSLFWFCCAQSKERILSVICNNVDA